MAATKVPISSSGLSLMSLSYASYRKPARVRIDLRLQIEVGERKVLGFVCSSDTCESLGQKAIHNLLMDLDLAQYGYPRT